jgi:hypothetical protein
VEEHEREEEKVPLVQLKTVFNQENEDEAEETEQVQEKRREVVEPAPSQVIAAKHNNRFPTDRDFREFIREPEAMTVHVQESFAPHDGAFLTETDFMPADEFDVCESTTSSRNRKPASSPSHVLCERVASSGNRAPPRTPNKSTSPTHARESVASSGKRTPPRTPKPPPQSRSVASRGSATVGRTSFATEFSVFRFQRKTPHRTPQRTPKIINFRILILT